MLRPGSIYYGSTVRLNVAYEDEDGEPFDPGAVTLETMDPTGSKTTYTYSVSSEIQRQNTGQYTGDFVANRPGRWRFRWGATDGSTTIYKEGMFTVRYSDFYNSDEVGDYGAGW